MVGESDSEVEGGEAWRLEREDTSEEEEEEIDDEVCLQSRIMGLGKLEGHRLGLPFAWICGLSDVSGQVSHLAMTYLVGHHALAWDRTLGEATPHPERQVHLLKANTPNMTCVSQERSGGRAAFDCSVLVPFRRLSVGAG